MMAMEATIFTGWIYDHLLPHAESVKVGVTDPMIVGK
jgi:transposase